MEIVIGLALFLVVAFWAHKKSERDAKESETLQDLLKQREDSPTLTNEINPDASETLPKDDAWEGWFFSAEEPHIVEAKLKIKYVDSNGNASERRVDVQKFDRNLYGGTFIGYCHLRMAKRTFRFDRIVEVVDLESGELVLNIGDWLYDRYKSSPRYDLDHLLRSSNLMNHYVLTDSLPLSGERDGQAAAGR